MGLARRTARDRLTSGTVAVPVGLGLLAGILLLVPLGAGGAGEVVRVVVGLPFVLVLPGYVLSRAVLPRTVAGSGHRGCSLLERICWTLALDVALLVAGALLLNALPAGLTRTSWVVLGILVLLVAGLVAVRRERAPGSYRGGPRLLPRTWPPPRRLVMSGAAVVIAGAAIGLAVFGEATKAAPGFSQLWLVPEAPAGPAPAGPARAAASETAQLGVYSDEDATRQFRVEVRPDGEPAQTWSFSLDPGAQWQQSVEVPGSVRTEALLFRGTDPAPYRQVWMQP